LVDHNSEREEEDHESLLSFTIEEHTIKIFN
jgi:hypothetical protein